MRHAPTQPVMRRPRRYMEDKTTSHAGRNYPQEAKCKGVHELDTGVKMQADCFSLKKNAPYIV